jgi:hypothetical protein
VIGIVAINCPRFYFCEIASSLFLLSLFGILQLTNYGFQKVEILVCIGEWISRL